MRCAWSRPALECWRPSARSRHRSGAVRRVTTPAGEVAAAAHYGEYSDLGGAYAALHQWCAANGRRQAGVTWEVYGDWDDDPAKRRTDVYKLLSPA